MMRKLASVRVVQEIVPIEGADNIELAIVDGWQCVCKKGEFQPNSLGIYFEVDSFLPGTDPRYEFLKTRFVTFDGKVGARIRTMKLRKQLSQGLLLPLASFPEVDAFMRQVEHEYSIDPANEGGIGVMDDIPFDVTELLGIVKWERPEMSQFMGGSMGTFPSFIPKTDQERVQNIINGIIPRVAEEHFQLTMKLDGSSLTAYVVQVGSKFFDIANDRPKMKEIPVDSTVPEIAIGNDNDYGIPSAEDEAKLNEVLNEILGDRTKGYIPCIYGVCSRNLELLEVAGGAFWDIVKQEDLINKLASTGKSYAIQGELVSPSIQKNYEKVSKPEFYCFAIWDIEEQKYLTPRVTEDVCIELDIPHVPIIFDSMLLGLNFENLQDYLDIAEGQGMNPGVNREGVVFKSHDSDITFKVISNKYLLKEE